MLSTRSRPRGSRCLIKAWIWESISTSCRAPGDGRVTISALDMHDITVRITPGTLQVLSEREFAADTREAVTALLADRRAKVRELKMRYFG